MQTLYAAEGRPDFLGTDAIPQGLTPGDIPVSEDDFKNANAQVGPAHGAHQQGSTGYGAAGYGHTGQGYGAGGYGGQPHAGSQYEAPPPAGSGYGQGGHAAPYQGASSYDAQGHGSQGHGSAGYQGAAAAAVGTAAASGAYPSSGADSKSSQVPPAHSEDAVPPPMYDDSEGYSAAPPPGIADDAGPRDASAEKEALRRQYAQQDAAGSTAGAGYSGTGSGSGSGSAALPAHSSHPSRVRAAYDFAGVESGDLTFHAGEVIDVTGMEGDQWYRGSITSNGQTRSGSEYEGPCASQTCFDAELCPITLCPP